MTSHRNLDVRRVKSSLVATFARANPPLIWRFDLERNHSFTLTLQGEDHDWELGVTSPKGDFAPVARFPSREDADEAFAAVSKILSQPEKSDSRWAHLAKTVGLLVLATFLLLLALRIFSAYNAPNPQAAIMDEYLEPMQVPEMQAAPSPAPTPVPAPPAVKDIPPPTNPAPKQPQ